MTGVNREVENAILNTLHGTRCNCDEPVIRCDNRGCRCTTCGLPEDVLRPQREREQVAVPDWMSRSYPYLSIARHFGADYGQVLDDCRRGVNTVQAAGYAEAMLAAQRLWDYVRRVGMVRALRTLGETNEELT